MLSPNERYLAYTSDISGRVEVHVRPFPEGAGSLADFIERRRCTRVGALEGNELFFDSAERADEGPRLDSRPVLRESSGRIAIQARARCASVEAPAPRYAVSARRQALPDGGAQIRVSRTGRAGRRELAHRVPSCAFTDARVEVQGMSCHSGRCGSATANA